MSDLSPEMKLDIARRVHETFQLRKRWRQGTWGHDDDGDVIEFDFGVGSDDEDDNTEHHPPTFRDLTPESPRCFCLSAAIRIHTVDILAELPARHLPDHLYFVLHATETMCAIYTEIGDIHTQTHEDDIDSFDAYFNSIIKWNDSTERRYQHIHDLTAAVVRHLDQPAPAPTDPYEPAEIYF